MMAYLPHQAAIKLATGPLFIVPTLLLISSITLRLLLCLFSQFPNNQLAPWRNG